MKAPEPRSCNWGRQGAAAAAVGGLLALVSLTGAPAAVAAENYLEFSLDGQTYSATVTGPVFDAKYTYVPGAGTSAELWIRNTSSEPAWLSSAAVVVRSDPEMNSYLGLRAGSLSNLSPRSPLGSTGSCTDMNQVWNLGAGQVIRLDFVADLALDAPNETQNRSTEFDLLFLLESTAAGTEPRAACAASGAGEAPLSPGGSEGQNSPGTSAGQPSSGTEDTNSGPGTLETIPGNTTQQPPARTAQTRNTGIYAPRVAPVLQSGVPGEAAPLEEPVALMPAGFQSTVEPVIRSLSGTLLIAMSVVFSAAVVLRLRNRSA